MKMPVISTYADLLALLDDRQGQCTEAKDAYGREKKTSVEQLWMEAANALSSARHACEHASLMYLDRVMRNPPAREESED